MADSLDNNLPNVCCVKWSQLGQCGICIYGSFSDFNIFSSGISRVPKTAIKGKKEGNIAWIE